MLENYVAFTGGEGVWLNCQPRGYHLQLSTPEEPHTTTTTKGIGEVRASEQWLRRHHTKGCVRDCVCVCVGGAESILRPFDLLTPTRPRPTLASPVYSSHTKVLS